MIEPLKIQIRFSDCDLMGHVNNACYLNYFELARMHYFNRLLPNNWDWKKNGIILRKNEVEYLFPLYLTDEPTVKIVTVSIGNKSFTLAYELMVNGKCITKGQSIIVCYDFISQKTIDISTELKVALLKLKH